MVQRNAITSQVDCGVCGQPLVYAEVTKPAVCDLCGRQESTLIWCPAGHFVCDACHAKAALDVLREVVKLSRTADSAAIAERVMAHPGVPMHGPEHHAIVPAAIVAAAINTGVPLGRKRCRGPLRGERKIPGGWCGYYGACGAAVGVGVAVSVITAATPIKGRERSLALAATSVALERMVDNEPRCCKRASRLALSAAVEFLHDQLGVDLEPPQPVVCTYSRRNAQCAQENCPYFAGAAQNEP